MTKIVAVLLDSNRGIYIPQAFARDFVFVFGAEHWTGVDRADLEICQRGPDEENYWEAWDGILQSAICVASRPVKFDGATYPAGTRFTLEQDGDLFMVTESTEF